MKKIPIVKQRDLRDCGPCCILSVIKYYNGFVPLEKIRSDSYTTNNGTTAFHLVNSLKKYGFDAYGATLDNEKLIEKELILPFIAHLILKNGLNHYVVVYKIKSKYILVMDPYKGIVKMKRPDFLEVFSNVVIMLYPQTSIIQYEKTNYKYFCYQLISKNKKIFLKILIASLAIVIFTILNGFYFKFGFNHINDIQNLKIIIFLFLYFTISKILFDYLSTYFKNHLIKNIDYQLNSDFFQKLYNLPSKIVKNRTVGEIATRVTELNNLHEIITEVLVTLILNLFLAISAFIVLYFIEISLLKILILFSVIFILICVATNNLIYRMIKKNIESNEDFNNKVIEYTNAFESIKNNNLELYVYEKMNLQIINYLKSNFEIMSTLNRINFLKNLIVDLMQFSIITFGFFQLLANSITLVNFITFETILVYLIEPIKNIMGVIPKCNYLKASLEKIQDFLSILVEKLDSEELFLNGNIEIKNLSFSYDNYNQVLSNINIDIKQNSFVMVKGKSGIGKSTFCKLLNRTYEYSKGEIKINNVNLKDYNLATIRKNILYLSQNEYLFDDTIKNNIILDCNFNLNKFNYICKICHIDEIVSKKPLRYETMLNKNFANLSGGERQRIVLARALYRNFKILILDEALSEVNEKLETDIIANLKKYLSNKTVIYITHKNHEKKFDEVIVLGDKNESK